jgi:hypothetical protein
MKLKHNPFPLIFARGDEVTRLVCLEFFGLGNSPQANGCLAEIIGQQRPDGSFPSPFDPITWGMLETVRTTLLLLRVGLPPKDVHVDSALRFVLDQQRRGGGWSENRALELPPEQTWLSNERGMTWLTADAVDLLRQVGKGGSSECQAAVRWLLRMQDSQGGWPSLAWKAGDAQAATSDPDATAQVTFLLGEILGTDDVAYRRGRKRFEGYLDECARDAERGYWVRLRDGRSMDLDVYHLTHLLLSWWLDPPRRFQAGYDAGDPRVKQMMEALVHIQGADGGWRPFFAEESSPVYTLLAVKALALSGVVGQDELEAGAKACAANRQDWQKD